MEEFYNSNILMESIHLISNYLNHNFLLFSSVHLRISKISIELEKTKKKKEKKQNVKKRKIKPKKEKIIFLSVRVRITQEMERISNSISSRGIYHEILNNCYILVLTYKTNEKLSSIHICPT